MHFKCPNVQILVFTWNIKKLHEVDVSRLAKEQKSHLVCHPNAKKKAPTVQVGASNVTLLRKTYGLTIATRL